MQTVVAARYTQCTLPQQEEYAHLQECTHTRDTLLLTIYRSLRNFCVRNFHVCIPCMKNRYLFIVVVSCNSYTSQVHRVFSINSIVASYQVVHSCSSSSKETGYEQVVHSCGSSNNETGHMNKSSTHVVAVTMKQAMNNVLTRRLLFLHVV